LITTIVLLLWIALNLYIVAKVRKETRQDIAQVISRLINRTKKGQNKPMEKPKQTNCERWARGNCPLEQERK
jgi:hypothetical protein